MKKLIIFLTLIGIQVSANPQFTYSELSLKDLEQMNSIVAEKIQQSQEGERDTIAPLAEGLQAVFSRPDGDGVISKVIGNLRSELDKHDAWEEVLNRLTVDALNDLRNNKKVPAAVQVTHLVFLENLLSEMKPFAKEDGFERSIVEKIRDAKIKISDKASAERSLKMIKASKSPSDIATDILKAADKDKPKKK
ncbi:MAG: hypothetical protein ACLGGX_02340 [Bdellovibrionia bacterium]